MDTPNLTFTECLKQILAAYLPHVPSESVHADAHLSFDLGLDSVELMQILVLLETQYCYSIPSTALNNEQLSTVGTLEQALTGSHGTSVGDPELDIKVHCVVSCLCHPLKAANIDHRPLYFGVWDAEVFVDDQSRLRYHAGSVDHQFFFSWFSRLYDVAVHEWYDKHASKAGNMQRLKRLLSNRAPSESIMVMLDMYRLPERENRFNMNPFPHYVMLEEMDDPEKIWMWDPDFRWEGALDRERVLNAVASPAVAGGYQFNGLDAREPRAADVAAYFDACFQPNCNGMTQAVEAIVRAHTSRENELAPAALGAALSEVPVLAIRKYAYEHGFAFFWRALHLPEQEFEQWCDVIEDLVRGFDRILFCASKFSFTQEDDLLKDIFALIAEQNTRERKIKTALYQVYRTWRDKALPLGLRRTTSEVAL